MEKYEAKVFRKTKTIDIDTFETIVDTKVFDLETGQRISFERTVIYQDYTGEISVIREVIQ